MEFKCLRCGNCCRWPGCVRTAADEVDPVAAFLHIGPEEFLDRFTRISPDRQTLSLTEKENGSCIFLDEESGDGLPACRIAPVKPRQCRDFPEKWNFPDWQMECAGGRESVWLEVRRKLAGSGFRSRFKLTRSDIDFIAFHGWPAVEGMARRTVVERLQSAFPRNDGKQTPMRGMPVFVAQHAIGACCRKCLAKWHNIPAGTELSEIQVNYVAEMICRWLRENADGVDLLPRTPELF